MLFRSFSRTSGNPTDAINGTISIATARKVTQAIRGATGFVFKGETPTQAQARAALGLATSNTWLVRNFINELTHDLPNE